ncbi:early nodulin-like protein 3 [Dioscorea cayenensis subsp. rotundata]|uniref:Early nodulin-like protein 3 n=1 Tax=Dioscorea cayennensis subsp. rotundata TaxID=55577 RepID=A0AB40BHL3_DIOCR|nr:early nodulin-like protein 3 [Dioscorea cayenensis subsp. rotundata]
MPSSPFSFLLLLTLLSFIHPTPISSFEFEVGGNAGWAVPSKDTQFYNHWASDNRFKIGDTINFKYDKDSVLVVEEGDYDKCDSAHPIFFSNNGNTVYTLDHSGAFYFISGIAEHCQKGQKMIIRVMGHSEGPGSSPDAGNHTGTHNVPSSSPNGSGGGLYEGFHAMHVSLLWVFFMFLGSLLF